MSDARDDKPREIWSYAIGYALTLALTLLAFAAVYWAPFSRPTTLAVVFGLALVQMAAHFRCFLHISLGKSSRDDLQLILFSSLIIVLMVSGTIVIMANLHQRMM